MPSYGSHTRYAPPLRHATHKPNLTPPTPSSGHHRKTYDVLTYVCPLPPWLTSHGFLIPCSFDLQQWPRPISVTTPLPPTGTTHKLCPWINTVRSRRTFLGDAPCIRSPSTPPSLARSGTAHGGAFSVLDLVALGLGAWVSSQMYCISVFFAHVWITGPLILSLSFADRENRQITTVGPAVVKTLRAQMD